MASLLSTLGEVGWNAVTSIAPGVATNKKVVSWVKDRLPTLLRPDNHDYYLGLRTAQLQASLVVLRDWEKSNPVEAIADGGEFVQCLRAYLNRDHILSFFLSVEDRLAGVATSELAAVDAAPTLGRDAARDTDEDFGASIVRASTATLAEFERHAGPDRGDAAPVSAEGPAERASAPLAIPASFRALFCDPEEKAGGWYAWFRLFLGEQIKENERFFKILMFARVDETKSMAEGMTLDLKSLRDRVLEAIEAQRAATPAIETTFKELQSDLRDFNDAQRKRSEEIKAELGLIQSSLVDLRRAVDEGWDKAEAKLNEIIAQLNREGAALELMLPTGGSDKHSNFSSLVYRYARDVFVGRLPVLTRLASELLECNRPGQKQGLKVGLLHGMAGSGKSRLALELVRAFREEYPIAGFVTGTKDRSAVDPSRIRNLTLSAPACLIVDYASGYKDGEELANFVIALAQAAERTGHAIRVLLIDRQSSGNWLKTFTTMVENSGIGVTSQTMPTVGLERLSDQYLLSIVRGRLDPKADDLSDGTILRYLGELDPHHRPLFAAILGEWLRGSKNQVFSRDEIFERLLVREEARIWFPDAAAKNDATLRERIKNTLCLSTMCRGLEMHAARECEPGDLPLMRFRAGEVADNERYALMLPSTGDRDRAGFLEPDLLGEWFVLNHLADNPGGTDRCDRLIQLAWELGGWEMPNFVVRCFQDFPDKVQEFGYLLPTEGQHVEKVAALCRTLVYQCHLHAEIAEDEADQDPASESAAALARSAADSARFDADRIFTTMRRHLDGVPARTEIVEDVAAALQMTHELLGRAIDPALGRSIGTETIIAAPSVAVPSAVTDVAPSLLARRAFNRSVGPLAAPES